MEHKKEMTSFEISKQCPKCLRGCMEVTSGGTMLSNPPLYPHECSLCGHRTSYHKTYPYIDREISGVVNQNQADPERFVTYTSDTETVTIYKAGRPDHNIIVRESVSEGGYELECKYKQRAKNLSKRES